MSLRHGAHHQGIDPRSITPCPAPSSERLAIALEGVDDGDRLAVVGQRIIDCADGAALLASLESQA